MRAVHAPLALLVVAASVCAACDQPGGTVEGKEGPVMILTHEGFGLSPEGVEALEESIGEPVVVVVEDDPASMLDLLTASSAGSGIDVVTGLDSLSVGTFLDAGLTARYQPVGAELLTPTLRLGDDPVTPISYTDVCFNYDRLWFDPPDEDEATTDDDEVLDAADVINNPTTTGPPGDGEDDQGEDDQGEDDADGSESGTESDPESDDGPVRPAAPGGLGALGREDLAGLVVVADPEHDPFTLAFIAGLGSGSAGPADPESTDPALVETLRLIRINDLLVADDFQDAYFGSFTAGAADGDRPVVLASALMPAVSVRFTDPLPAETQTAVVDDGCARLVDYAAVVAGTERPELARRALDAMVEPEFQFSLSDERGSRPARTDMARRPEVVAFEPTIQPVLLDPVTTAAAVPALLRAWDEAGLLVQAGTED